MRHIFSDIVQAVSRWPGFDDYAKRLEEEFKAYLGVNNLENDSIRWEE